MNIRHMRSYPRCYHEVPILISAKNFPSKYKKKNHFYTYATMLNSSRGGIYIELNYALQPGTEVELKFTNSNHDDSNNSEAYETICAQVIWCMDTSDTVPSIFGAGLKFYKPANNLFHSYKMNWKSFNIKVNDIAEQNDSLWNYLENNLPCIEHDSFDVNNKSNSWDIDTIREQIDGLDIYLNDLMDD